jgi:hypothetical protein
MDPGSRRDGSLSSPFTTSIKAVWVLPIWAAIRPSGLMMV